jgi:hypothetical protein
VTPAWLQSVAPSDWYKRYGRRIEDDRLPQSKEKRAVYAQTMGEDGFLLLDRLAGVEVPAAWRELPTVEALRLVLARHYERVQPTLDGQATSQVRFKENRELERAAEGIESPYDTDARYRSRYGMAWTGYIVHLSESCDKEEVHLITHVETTEATVHEAQKTEAIHRALVEKNCHPLNTLSTPPTLMLNYSSIAKSWMVSPSSVPPVRITVGKQRWMEPMTSTSSLSTGATNKCAVRRETTRHPGKRALTTRAVH